MNHQTKSYNQSVLEFLEQTDRLKKQLVKKYGPSVERWWW